MENRIENLNIDYEVFEDLNEQFDNFTLTSEMLKTKLTFKQMQKFSHEVAGGLLKGSNKDVLSSRIIKEMNKNLD